ncbi:MAG: glycosyltransferase [Flavobacteriales bacterium]|nr:glycosyltransferase [Flavobacteriales bacterium]
MSPRITIITPSFQQAPFLEACLASIHSQGYPDLEHIVVDGGSTDGSRAIIERFGDRLSWWCSEPDRGQSHAINKGLERATGGVFGWINSDDTLLPGALDVVGKAFRDDPELMVLQGVRIAIHENGAHEPLQGNDPGDPDALFIAPRIAQQSTFFRSEAVRKAGGVDERLHHVMDLELWLRLLFTNGTAHLRFIDTPLATFRMHPESKSSTAQHRFVDETAGVLKGLCDQVGLRELGGILALGHRIPAGIRTIAVGPDQRDLVERMTVRFLLHWNRVVHERERFDAMRAFLASPYARAPHLTAAQQERLKVIAEQVHTSWLAFRVRRKLRHLWG